MCFILMVKDKNNRPVYPEINFDDKGTHIHDLKSVLGALLVDDRNV